MPAQRSDAAVAPAPRAAVLLQTRGVQVLLYTGTLVFGAVWWVEYRAGLLTPWDAWLLPLLGCVVFASALALTFRPGWQGWLMLLNVIGFNLYLVGTLHATLHFGDRALQWFQFSTVLYWVPLGYGMAFVFVGTRAALAVSAVTFVGLFAPLTWVALRGQPPAWSNDFGSFLAVIAMAHGMYVVLLIGVVMLRASQTRAEERASILHALATTDVLTGLPNRRALHEALQGHLLLAGQRGKPLAVALIDIDHFKDVNDQHGHAAGDAVLQEISQVMRAGLRQADQLGRWGGEEFLLCLPDTPISAAADTVERLRLAVAAHPFPHGQPVTVSIGLAQLLCHDSLEQLLQRTDRALYRAKAQGRNRTETQVLGAGA